MTEIYLEHASQRAPVTAAAPLTVGSGAACGLRIQAAGVEEEHAIVRLDGDRVVLQSKVPGEGDARVNGVAVHAASLQNGDTVRFGDVEATFETGGGAARLRLPDASHDLVRGVNAIGREPGTGVSIGDESVSRKHAAIFILPSGQVVLRDLGSANGTVVQGRRLGEIELKAGDEIRLGDAVLHLRRQEATPAPAAAPATGMAGTAAAMTVVGARPPAAAPRAAGAPAGPKLELEFRGAKRALHEGTVLIGRAPDCQLIIDDDALVSRHHAELRITGGQAVLRDLGSSNGTRINGATISGERPLQDGDRIGIGKQELVFSADVPVTPFAQTMVARELPGAGGRTMVAPLAGGAAGRAAAGGAGILPTDRESALLTLDLAADAGEDQIQRRYRELYSEFQIRLTNAPTQDLKATYERRLNELRAAAGILLPRSAAGVRDLPALEPIAVGPEAGAAAAASHEPVMASAMAAGAAATPAAAPAAAVKAAKRDAGKKGLPRSTVMVAIANVLLIGAAIFCALGSMRAGKIAAELQAERDAKQAELQRVEAAIPETTKAVEALSQAKGELLVNADLKICNHSSGSLEWVWLNTAWFDEEAGKFRQFDTALDTNYEYLTYEKIEPGATFAGGQWVVGDQRVWPGQAIFFAALFYYGGDYVLRVDATPTLGGNCFPLNLDQ